MSQLLVHDMGTAWPSTDAAVLHMTVDTTTFADPSGSSGRLEAAAGAGGQSVALVPGVPVDLSGFEELRYWVLGDRPAEGSPATPFLLELSFDDAGDLAGEQHRWFVPVNGAGVWEQRRVGIEGERRSQVTAFRFTALTDTPFVVHVDELLAVHEELLADVEQALVEVLGGLSLPGTSGIPLAVAAHPGDTQVTVGVAPGFSPGNRVRLGGGPSPEEHTVASVTDAGGQTALGLDAADPIVGSFPAATGTVTLLVPVVAEAPPAATVTPTPAVLLTCLELREDPGRTGEVTQRDSFHARGSTVVCSVRPMARPYLVDYQITTIAPVRGQQVALYERLAARLTADLPLRVNGYPSPVSVLPAPELLTREPGSRAPLYVRIGTRMERASRQEQTWVRRTDVRVAPPQADTDGEEIVLEL